MTVAGIWVGLLTGGAGSIATIAALHDRWSNVIWVAVGYFVILSVGLKVNPKEGK